MSEAARGVHVRYEGEPVLAAGTLTRFTVALGAETRLAPGTQFGLARRWPSDWGTPQSSDPASADYLAIEAGDHAVRWWTARRHAWHPFDHVLFVELPYGLPAGTSCTLRFGDVGGGSPGFTVQTFIEEASPLLVRLLQPGGDAWIEIARPTVQIVGTTPHALVLTAPSRVNAGETFDLHVRVEDRWGNPAPPGATVTLAPPIGRDVEIPACGWLRVPVALHQAGVHRLQARARGHASFAATSNPIEVRERTSARLYWGDLHAQSVIGCGARSIDAYYQHARDFAAADFASHQANCFLVSNPEWSETQASAARHREDGRFVTLLGVEWSGASAVGGDHNLYFRGDEAPLHRCSHEFVTDKSDAATDLPHITQVHDRYRGSDTLVALHVGGRTTDLRWHEPALDRLVEVHSTHATSEWFLHDALRRGYRMGVVAGSDSVDGRPGASHPGHMGVRNVRGGLTAVEMPELTRAALWQALKSRRCYATTGERILLSLRAGDARMGDEIRVARVPSFDVEVEGTAPIESIDFYRDDRRIASVDRMAQGYAPSRRLRVAWCGASAPGNWQRARMDWDGELRVDNARIVAAHPWAFDTPDEGLRAVEASRVAWRSITAGDWDGVMLELDAFDADLTFVTAPMSVRASLRALGATPATFDADAPQRRLELRRMPVTMPSPGWHGRFDDPASTPGPHAYWVRVRQCDGALAWSTPIFVTLEP
ncbi:MAG TPA: DUF3604 domain-containing protein [Casimicrobiaceae bacterium]